MRRFVPQSCNNPQAAKFSRARQVIQDMACADYSEPNPGVSSPAGTSQDTGKLGQPFLHRLASFFSRRRDEPIQSDSPFL